MKTGYLLDTDIIIYWLKGMYPQINRRINELGSEYIAMSTITVAELYFGAYNSSKKEKNIFLVDELISAIRVLSLDVEGGRFFGRTKANLKRAGIILSDSDLLIASIAVSNDLVLVSNNQRHFPESSILGLRIGYESRGYMSPSRHDDSRLAHPLLQIPTPITSLPPLMLHGPPRKVRGARRDSCPEQGGPP